MKKNETLDYAAPPAKSQQPKNSLRKKKFFLPILIILIAAAALIILFFAVKRKAETMLASLQSDALQEMQAAPGNIINTINGSGTLSYADTEDILIPEGLEIETVYVSIGDTVKKGQKLASIDSASAAGALYQLNNDMDALSESIKDLPEKANDTSSNEHLQKVQMEKQLEDLKEDKKELEKIYQTGLIKASCDGVIDTVNLSSGTVSGGENAASESSSQNIPDLSSLMGMSTKNQASPAAVLCTSDSTHTQEPEAPQPAAPILITEQDLASLKITAPKSGAAPQTEITETTAYTGAINWDCPDTFEMDTAYTATILLTSKTGYAFSSADNYGIIIPGATLSNDTPKIIGGDNTAGNRMLLKASFQTSYTEVYDDIPVDEYEDGPDESVPSGNLSEEDLQAVLDALQKNLPGTNPSLDQYTGSLPGYSDSDLSGLTDSGNSNTYTSISQMTAFTIASGDEMLVPIQINELDINSVEVGQTAVLTMDALEDQTFQGKISSIRTASSDGDVRYLAEITLKRKDGMRTGMSVSAAVNVEEAKGVIVIPVDALQEDGDTYFVFTQLDDENTPSGKHTVETGISDGINVEITSGLTEGDTIYYNQSSTMSDLLMEEEGAVEYE